MAGRYKKWIRAAWLLTTLFLFGMMTGCAGNAIPEMAAIVSSKTVSETLAEDGSYTSKEDVALYLHIYGHLPHNYITKKEAQQLGWDSKKGNLEEVAPGKSIGGSHYGNYEGLLPEKEGRKYYECDLDYEGGYRGAQRLVYSNDGLIFYTEDHYQSFEQLYEP